MPKIDLPAWISNLEEEDLHFIRRLVLASGSLKELAAEYGVSYPTIRARLDGVIERVKILDKHDGDDPLEARIRILVAEGGMEPKMGKDLLTLHRNCFRRS
jgi:hypothetical protein